MKKLFFLLLLSILCGSCKSATQSSSNVQENQADPVTISAAVSLKEAFNEIGDLYKSKSGKTVLFNYGASGALQKQIETGAPVDVFASAGEKQMDELMTKGLIDAQSRQNFAQNEMVLIVPLESKLNLKEFVQLKETNVQKIAVGNPKTVPAGQYTAQIFDKLGLRNDLQSKLIFAEDVRQVLDYVSRGETDAGIVYTSDAQIAAEKVRVAATAPKETHDPILYPAAVIKDSQQKESAQEFINLILSQEGQNILRKYGFANAIK